LVDVAALIVIAGVSLAIGLPSAGRAREMSKRSVCALNLKGLGEASRVYANANEGQWMVPAFDERQINHQGIDYTGFHPYIDNPGAVGYERLAPSDGSSTALSTTRAFWMLVRSGDAQPRQLVCPSSEDRPDSTKQVELYYDFTDWQHVSYGYQVPFGPAETRARENANPGQVFAADKGPFSFRSNPSWVGATLSAPPSGWKHYNSRNHRNGSDTPWTGEGQNCLFADGGVSFARTPIVGVDHDNIYTVIVFWGSNTVIHGETPWVSYPHPYPGQGVFGWQTPSTTDSLIYP
jgi:hypothetical protein